MLTICVDFRELALAARDPRTHGSITPAPVMTLLRTQRGGKKRDNRAMAFLSPNPITLVTSGAGSGPIQNKHAVFI